MENRGTYPQMVYTIFSYDTIDCIGIRILYLEQIPKFIYMVRIVCPESIRYVVV